MHEHLKAGAFFATALAGCLLAGCGDKQAEARAQWEIEVQTDAPIPLVGDRVLIELLDESGLLACSSCRRDATAARAADWAPLSFGVESSSRALYLRTRLYRADHIKAETGQPDSRTSIDSLTRLPPLAGGVMKVYVALRLDCLGLGVVLPGDGGALATCADASRAMVPPPEASRDSLGLMPNTSPLLKAVKQTCPAGTPPGMVCIPGGVFFLGSSLAPAPHVDVNAAPTPERFVGVHAFLLDQTEVLAADFAAWAQANLVATCDKDLIRCKDEALPLRKFCSLTVNPAEMDPWAPMNCVSWGMADRYCKDNGKRLPTETEWEFVASNGSMDTRFTWGEDPPTCESAVLARDFEIKVGAGNQVTECLSIGIPGPGRLQPSDLDAVKDKTLPIGAAGAYVYNLAGNVAEWTSDAFETYDPKQAASPGKTPCWKDGAEVLLLDPKCPPETGYEERSVRGGSWRESLQGSWSANRSHMLPEPIVATPEIGFRCACNVDPATGNCVK